MDREQVTLSFIEWTDDLMRPTIMLTWLDYRLGSESSAVQSMYANRFYIGTRRRSNLPDILTLAII